MGKMLSCSICGGQDIASVFRTLAPMLHLVPAEAEDQLNVLPEIDIVGCSDCGHLFNRLFDPDLATHAYARSPVTNVPVHPSMNTRLENLFAWLDGSNLRGSHILEIGAGSGQLARLFADVGACVTLFEPSLGLKADAFPEPNITLHSHEYTGLGARPSADIVLCRQVLEHIEEPNLFVAMIAADTKPGGLVYLEVPNSGYITDYAAVQDLHAQHVHYFMPENVISLAACHGLEMVRTQFIKDQHDVGILFIRKNCDTPLVSKCSYDMGSLKCRLQERERAYHNAIAKQHGRLALYGATMQGSVFFGLVENDNQFTCVLDDNSMNYDFVLRGRAKNLLIMPPNKAVLADLDAIVITAYLHDTAIAERLRDMNFLGRIFTTRPAPLENNSFSMQSLLG
jgi:2-polyprenyl-3-methyl-5-hydroxy-6-metoxy-1,4-benzoquinol methylase